MKKDFFKRQGWHSVMVSAAIVSIVLSMIFITNHYNNRKKAVRKISDCKFKLRKNADARRTYMATASEFTQRARLHKVIDSLNFVNDTMLDNAMARYYDRIDSQHILRNFFYKEQIKELNQIIDKRIIELDIEGTEIYQYVMGNMPLNEKTPLAVFETIVRILGFSSTDFENTGVIFDNGYIFMFTLSRPQANFLRYLDECEHIRVNGDGPNFEIPELKEIQGMYVKNKKLVSRLDGIVQYDDSIARGNLAQFDTIQNQLKREMVKYQNKLK